MTYFNDKKYSYTDKPNYEDSAYHMLAQARDLRLLFGQPVDSCAACDHDIYLNAFRESFSHFTQARAISNQAGIIEHITYCALILCSYKTDAGKHMQLSFKAHIKDLHDIADLHDFNLVRTVIALVTSEQTKLITSNDLDATRQYYSNNGITCDFNHRRDSRFICFNKTNGDTLPGLNYQEPDWEDTERWARVRIQAA
ncbi:hypothetical protein SAMN03080615_01625 [Amphritea atlantica]|uniref:Uncharacterized protein n=1 Tax=Amphritea atlantica TaxID=355243 RepID=A0A1H9GDZ0_9GAMM|nr:hypothetical protein [Amphritea atlantica]SEQ48243.1 hypothetical protein SAMN03080615_01625 [Amphritea atlantica]